MLVNEYFKSTAVITNSFDLALQNVGVSITVPPNLRNKGKQFPDICVRKFEKVTALLRFSFYHRRCF